MERSEKIIGIRNEKAQWLIMMDVSHALAQAIAKNKFRDLIRGLFLLIPDWV